jgi:hypothetical protein
VASEMAHAADRAPRHSVERLVRDSCDRADASAERAHPLRDATIAPVRPAAKESPVAMVRTTSGPLGVPTISRTTHAPKQTALIASSVILSGEIQSCHVVCAFSGAFIVSTPPNFVLLQLRIIREECPESPAICFRIRAIGNLLPSSAGQGASPRCRNSRGRSGEAHRRNARGRSSGGYGKSPSRRSYRQASERARVRSTRSHAAWAAAKPGGASPQCSL